MGIGILKAKGTRKKKRDYGQADRSGFIYFTNSFTLAEVQLLVKVLKNKFDLNCSIHSRKDKVNTPYLIYIKADS